MKIVQISPTAGEACGIAIWADDLGAHLAGHGFTVRTSRLDGPAADLRDADVLLVQHHDEFLVDDGLVALCRAAPCPVVLFAHSGVSDALLGAVDAVLAMSPGLVPGDAPPSLVFPHPAFTADLEARSALRAEFGLPPTGKVLGSCGFLKFDRQFVELLGLLLPRLAEVDASVHLMTSPWRLDSPGVLDGIAELGAAHPGRLRHVHRMLDDVEMHRRLQACDLLWCWTRAPSESYASGVVSRLYASGSRVAAADKAQHEHVLGLPNAVRAPASLPEFVDVLVAEVSAPVVARHDPDPVSWRHVVPQVTGFLGAVRDRGRTRTARAAWSG